MVCYVILSLYHFQANHNRDALAKSLYSRMLSSIVRRGNCSRKSTLSSDYHSPSSSSEFLTTPYDTLTDNGSQGIEFDSAQVLLRVSLTVMFRGPSVVTLHMSRGGPN